MDTLKFTENAIQEVNADSDLHDFVRNEIEEWVSSQILVTIIFDDDAVDEDEPILRKYGESEGCKKGPTLPVDIEQLYDEFGLSIDDVRETDWSISLEDISRFCPNGKNPHLWKFMSKIELVIPEHFMRPIFSKKCVSDAFKTFKKQLQGDGEDKKDFQSILPGLIARFKTLERYSMLIPAFVDKNVDDFIDIFEMIQKSFLSEESNKKRKVE
jgi:hypothetical protein